MAVNLSPVGGVAAQFFNNDGTILLGGKIYTYFAGTNTPAVVYTTTASTIAHSNPIILDSAGRVPTGEIWLTDGLSYKFVLKDANDVLIATYDNIVGINSNFVNFTNQQEIQTATAGQTVFTLTTMQYQIGTGSLSVFVDGVNQYGPSATYSFTETSSTVVTFNSGLNVGALVKFTTSAINASSYGNATQIGFTGFLSQVGNVQNLAGNDGSDWIGFLQNGTNAVARSAQNKMRDIVSVKDFGAVGDGTTNDTVAIQNALNYCKTSLKTLFFPAGYYAVTESSVGSGYALLNKGVSMVGEGTFYSQIVPLASMPNTADFICVTPNNNEYIDYLEFGRFSINPAYGGTKRGRYGIYLYTPQATNLSRWYVHDLYILPGNDYSLKVENNNTINIQGVPANSVIERNMFWEGIYLNKIGDSVTIRNNVFRSSVGSTRTGVYLYMNDASGVASHTMITENNFDCPGGAVVVERGRNVKVNYNNIELSSGTGSGSGAIIDIDGLSGLIPWAEVTGNHLGTFGTANPDSMIRINAGAGVTVDKNTLLTAFSTRAAIFITSSANNTDVGFNEIGTTFVTPVDDHGLETIGTPRLITPVGGWSNTGGSYQTLTYFKSRDGVVTLGGVLTAPATPNGVGLGNLPLGYRPTTIVRSVVSAVISGNVSSAAIEIDTSGNIIFYGSNSTTRIEICAAFSTPNYVLGNL